MASIFNKVLQLRSKMKESASEQLDTLNVFAKAGSDALLDDKNEFKDTFISEGKKITSASLTSCISMQKAIGSSEVQVTRILDSGESTVGTIDLATHTVLDKIEGLDFSINDIMSDVANSMRLNEFIADISDLFLYNSTVATTTIQGFIDRNITNLNVKDQLSGQLAIVGASGSMDKMAFLQMVSNIVKPTKDSADHSSFEVITDSPFPFVDFMTGVLNVVSSVISAIFSVLSTVLSGIWRLVAFAFSAIAKLLSPLTMTHIKIKENSDNEYLAGALYGSSSMELSGEEAYAPSLRMDECLIPKCGPLEAALWNTGDDHVGFNVFFELGFNAKKWFELVLADPVDLGKRYTSLTSTTLPWMYQLVSFSNILEVAFPLKARLNGGVVEYLDWTMQDNQNLSELGLSDINGLCAGFKLSRPYTSSPIAGYDLYAALFNPTLAEFYGLLLDDEETLALHTNPTALKEQFMWCNLLSNLALYRWSDTYSSGFDGFIAGPSTKIFPYIAPLSSTADWTTIKNTISLEYLTTLNSYGVSGDTYFPFNAYANLFGFALVDAAVAYGLLGSSYAPTSFVATIANLGGSTMGLASDQSLALYIHSLMYLYRSGENASDNDAGSILGWKHMYQFDPIQHLGNDYYYVFGQFSYPFISYRYASSSHSETNPSSIFVPNDVAVDPVLIRSDLPYRDYLRPHDQAIELPSVTTSDLIAAAAIAIAMTTIVFIAGRAAARKLQSWKEAKKVKRTQMLQDKKAAINQMEPGPERDAAIQQYGKDVAAYNRKAKWFGWGSYDASNGWINEAAGGVGDLATSASSSYLMNNDVLKAITGEYSV